MGFVNYSCSLGISMCMESFESVSHTVNKLQNQDGGCKVRLLFGDLPNFFFSHLLTEPVVNYDKLISRVFTKSRRVLNSLWMLMSRPRSSRLAKVTLMDSFLWKHSCN